MGINDTWSFTFEVMIKLEKVAIKKNTFPVTLSFCES